MSDVVASSNRYAAAIVEFLLPVVRSYITAPACGECSAAFRPRFHYDHEESAVRCVELLPVAVFDVIRVRDVVSVDHAEREQGLLDRRDRVIFPVYFQRQCLELADFFRCPVGASCPLKNLKTDDLIFSFDLLVVEKAVFS